MNGLVGDPVHLRQLWWSVIEPRLDSPLNYQLAGPGYCLSIYCTRITDVSLHPTCEDWTGSNSSIKPRPRRLTLSSCKTPVLYWRVQYKLIGCCCCCSC